MAARMVHRAPIAGACLSLFRLGFGILAAQEIDETKDGWVRAHAHTGPFDDHEEQRCQTKDHDESDGARRGHGPEWAEARGKDRRKPGEEPHENHFVHQVYGVGDLRDRVEALPREKTCKHPSEESRRVHSGQYEEDRGKRKCIVDACPP